LEERIDRSNESDRDQSSGESSKANKAQGTPGRARTSIALVVVVALLSSLLGGFVAAFFVPYIYGSTPQEVFGNQPAPGQGSTEVVRVDGESMGSVTAVAKKLRPSVVNINIKQSISDGFHPDVVSGAGSGVIFRSDGYILTNNHVVEGAKDIFVTIGTDEVKGKVVAADDETDLAVVKVDRKNLPAAEFGSTKNLQVGELAVAIGSPFGFEHTVTSGIISALNRTVSIPDESSRNVRTYTNLIQTDAPINPGNSGGALSDAQGRVIGINTLIISTSGVSEGVGFAIPVETAASVAKQLIEKGKASHPYIGIRGQNVDSTSGSAGDLKAEKGAVVVEVIKGSPASKAGLKKDDIIIAVGGKSIESMDELIAEVRQRKVGDSLELTILRNGKRDNIEVVLAEKPKS